MRRYTVKYQTKTIPTTCGEVIVNRSVVFVEADYFRIEGGAAVFRRYAERHEQYPQTVHVFAPGVWAEIEEGL